MFLILSIITFNLIYGEVAFPWVAYYGEKAPTEAFDAYNPIVFDSDKHPALAPLLKKKKQILGYIDLAEVEESRSWFPLLKEKGLLISENPDWKGSWAVDIRKSYWKEILINAIIPNILAQGFNGLFFDQLDVALALEKKDSVKYKGMTSAAVDLIWTIRHKFPNIRLMMNRAYEILPQVGDAIDYELAETLYTSYNFETKKYYIRPQNEYDWQLAQLNAARTLFPHLVIFSIDYWDPSDKEMYKKIYEIEQKNFIRPYVSTIALIDLVRE